MRALRAGLAACAAAALLAGAGCAGDGGAPPAARRAATAAAIAVAAGLQPLDLAAAPFVLRAYARFARPPAPVLTVYLEGDGLAWESRTRLSQDPTPRNPLALRLAAADPAPSVAWLARPCQYLSRLADGAACPAAYWSGSRFAPEVVRALDLAVDRLKTLSGAAQVELVGYSGGGGIAVLLAAARDDVAGLITVAGNLDHPAWTSHHGVTPLAGSLDPAAASGAVAAVPQVHLAGARDAVMPPQIAAAYLDRLPEDAPVALTVVPGYAHDCCWAADWPALAGRTRDLLADLRAGR